MSTDAEKVIAATDLILSYGSIDGAHHKMWVLDQALRILSGNKYEDLIEVFSEGEEGPNTYFWDIGVAP